MAPAEQVAPGWVTGPVTVEVPATSANLGPGFDCLGLALELADTLVAQVRPEGLAIEVEGEAADQVPRDERHLVLRSMQVAFTALDGPPPGLRLHCTNRIPHSRGMGSSSAAIVGGLVLARALVPDGAARLDDAALLALANRIEGHPDNVAPALLGGFVVSGQAGEVVWAQRVDLDPRVRAVVAVPSYAVATAVARGLLPAQVTHADAAANTGRAALLVAALAGEPGLLLRATEDFLHQQHREPAMPETLAVVAALRADGVPAVISGAGPTVLAFVTDGATVGASEVPDVVARHVPAGWTVLPQAVGGPGARVLA
ncbi:homoserine kinase [Nocardioides aurantiacus]|uniref:homoserine kinase n=1 Tax=Nocardioides aurantiacus TaxID=86796 RepID=UPI00403F4AC5